MFDMLIERYCYFRLGVILRYLRWRFQVELKIQLNKENIDHSIIYQEFQVEIPMNLTHIHLLRYISICIHLLIVHWI